MKAIRFLQLLAAALLAAGSATAQPKTPTEAQCRDMVNGMLQQMNASAPRAEREKQGAQKVIDRAEKVVRENRARGASECDSWAAITNLVTNQ